MNEKRKILLVDDNQSLITSMAMVMRHAGYEVYSATNGLEAVQYVERQSYDIIFLDIKMPVMGGLEAFKKIREIDPDITVIIMTAYQVEQLREEALELGAKGILNKPFDLKQVLRSIDQYGPSKQLKDLEAKDNNGLDQETHEDIGPNNT
jgi:CheY-like chemotaxis protein